MTVSYTAEVATSKGFGCFIKLLFRWRGGIYKLVWPDLFLFLGTYFALSFTYRRYLNLEQQKVFEQIVRHCEKYGNLIPVSFVLGFYVSIVVGRWWNQFSAIPWPDSIAVFVSANIQGQDEKSRMMRRTIMRYCCLSLTMTFTMISPRVKKRFPTLDHLIEAGLLLENEKEIIEELNRSVPGYSKQWMPIVWAGAIVTRARREGKVRDDFAVKTILDELNKFRSGCGLLISYDWISVPLVYTQVVTLAVYSYFLTCVMGRQWLIRPDADSPDDPKGNPQLDLIFPIFTTLQFFFYMGWLKVAESLVNPFGDDDDDYELNWMIDRNLQVSYLIVDEMHNNHPELVRDQYWDEVFPTELPHTVASDMYRDEPPAASTANIHVSKDDGEIIATPSVRSIFQMPGSVEPGRRISVAASKRGSIVGRRERTASVRSTASQLTLTESISGRLSNAGSVRSVFRRMFSRDRDRDDKSSELGSPVDGPTTGWAGSAMNMQRNVAEDVIEELDENMTTIVSMRKEKKPPTIYDIFGTAPTPTAPVDIPASSVTQRDSARANLMDTASAREKFFQPERPTQLSVSAPPDGSKIGAVSFAPTTSSASSSSTDEPSQAPTASPPTLSISPPDTGFQSDSPSTEERKDDSDLSMQVANRKPEGENSSEDGSSNFAKKLVQTLGFKDASKQHDDSAEVHLLSDVSTIKEDSEEDDTDQSDSGGAGDQKSSRKKSTS